MYYKTDFNGYAVKFSPFHDGRLAVATSQNFGIIGNGRQYVLQVLIDIKMVCCAYRPVILHQFHSCAGYATGPAASGSI